MRRGLRRPRLGGATRARGRAEITSAPSQARSRRGSSSPRCGWFDWCVPPETVPPMRAPALLTLSLAFLALVGWGPALTASGGSHSHAASAGGGSADRGAAVRAGGGLIGWPARGGSVRGRGRGLHGLPAQRGVLPAVGLAAAPQGGARIRRRPQPVHPAD